MISAVIPVQDRFEYLNETIASVFAQTRVPDEVLIVDDCSTVPVEDFFARNPPPGPVTVVRMERSRNCGGARNRGWRLAKGDLIAFNDSDDIWEPDKIRMQAEYMESHPEADGVYGSMVAFYPDGTTKPWAYDRPPLVDIPSALLGANMTIQTLMIRRKALETLNGFDETFTNLSDQVFAIEIGRAGLRVVFLPSPVVTRLRRGCQSITNHSVRYYFCSCRIALRYRRLSAEFFGPGSVLVHLSRAMSRFGAKTRGMGPLTRILSPFLARLVPRSRMPQSAPSLRLGRDIWPPVNGFRGSK
jgi:glycosyltransferase involved in cell wall biosynthesis